MKLKYISWLPAAFLMCLIFYFSSKPADISGQSSIAISKVILNLYEDVSHLQIPDNDRTEALSVLDHIVRKTAHFIEYAVLAVAFALHFTLWTKLKRYRYFLPIILAGLYAATDEYHQTFVAGRSGQITDVLLDTTGAATGVLLFSLLLFTSKHSIYDKRKCAKRNFN